MTTEPTPFKGRRATTPRPMRVLRSFVKPGHRAEICERTTTPSRAIEFIVFVDGSLLKSQLFHGDRLSLYSQELETRIAQFVNGGWSEVSVSADTVQ
jgi:hypothetical protein